MRIGSGVVDLSGAPALNPAVKKEGGVSPPVQNRGDSHRKILEGWERNISCNALRLPLKVWRRFGERVGFGRRPKKERKKKKEITGRSAVLRIATPAMKGENGLPAMRFARSE